jgi:hypothetical protein
MTVGHDLLPWYVNGTLEAGEREAFEEHLKRCASCSQELPVLEELRRHVSEPGWGEHAEHPDPEALSRVVVDGADDPAMRRHLAVCVTCAEEARWLRGEEAAEGPAARHPHVAAREVRGNEAPRTRSATGWAVPLAAAAAVMLLVAARILWSGGGSVSRTGLGPPVLVPAAERELGSRQDVPMPAGAAAAHMLFQVDLASDQFPARFEVIGSGGRALFTKPDLVPGDLAGGGILLFTCDRGDCPPGDYTARVTPFGASRPAIDYPFRIVAGP